MSKHSGGNCLICRKPLSPTHKDGTDFTTFAGMEVLLKGLETKGCCFKIALYVGYSCHIWTVDQSPTTDEPTTALANNLPDAVAGAVLKLIEQGETNG